MRDWLFVLFPLAVVVYFVLNPSQFWEILAWLVGLMW